MEGSAPRRPVSSVAREAKDLLLKLQAAGLGGGFLASLGIDLPPIVEALPSELPILEVRVEQPDSLFRLANRAILQFEFQSTKDPTDLRRFYRYHYAVSEHYDSEVYTVVFYGPGISDAPSVLRRGSMVFTVTNVYIGQKIVDQLLGGPGVANPLEKFIEDALLRRLAEGKAEGELEGVERGQIAAKRDDILAILASRFGTVPPGISEPVGQMTDVASLRSLVIEAATTNSLESFARHLEQNVPA